MEEEAFSKKCSNFKLKSSTAFIFLFLSIVLPSFLSSCKKKHVDLNVLAATSLTEVCNEIKALYEEEHPDTTISYTYGASGTLESQIKENFPCDIFFSSGLRQMNTLRAKGLMLDESIRNVVENQLVLIVPNNSTLPITSFFDLENDYVKTVAFGEFRNLSAGQYTRTICEKIGIWDEVGPKVKFLNSTRSIISVVESGHADAGTVYATDAARSDKVKIIASAPEGSCPHVIYPVGIVKTSTKKEEAQNFLNFLFSEKAIAIFEKAGFTFLDK